MPSRRSRLAGFTLVELLVALSIMALLSILSWRGLDGMTRIQSQTRQRADDILTLQAGLAQWSVDLDALAPVVFLGQTPGDRPESLDWNGHVLRMTRFSSAPSDSGLRVVAWTQRGLSGHSRWLRWQSAVLHTQGELLFAWRQADRWALNPGDAEKTNEVVITPLVQWQIFYFRDEGWTHPLSSDGQALSTAKNNPTMSAAHNTIPDGVRLVLTLPTGQALNGTLTHDWVRPTLGGNKL